MVLIHQYLELYESASISSIWKGLQISLYIIGALTSIGASFCFGTFNYHYFDNNCILYSSVTFVKDGSTNCHEKGCNSTILEVPFGMIDLLNTTWDKDDTCEFCIYSSVCSFIISLVWATFFTMCGKGGRAIGGLPSSWRIVFPALIINTTYFIISLVAACYMGQGMSVFCTKFMETMKEDSCGKLSDYDQSRKKHALVFLTISKILLWATAFIWLLSIMLLILRCICVSDFELFRIEIITPTLSAGEISRIEHGNAKNSKRGSRRSSMNTLNNQQNESNIESNNTFQGKQAESQERIVRNSIFKNEEGEAIIGTRRTYGNNVMEQNLPLVPIFENAEDLANGVKQMPNVPVQYTVMVHKSPGSTEQSLHTDTNGENLLNKDSSSNEQALSLLPSYGENNNNPEVVDGQREDHLQQLDKEGNIIDLNPALLPCTDSQSFQSAVSCDDITTTEVFTQTN